MNTSQPTQAEATFTEVAQPIQAAAVGQTVFSELGNPAIEEIENIAKDVLELLP